MVQVSALLLLTLEDMGPTFAQLVNLIYSLGITPIFSNQYYYEDSNSAIHLRPLLHINDSISLINVFLIIIGGPIVMGTIFKVISARFYKDTSFSNKAWKYSFGTFLFYGLLFLAYA